MGRCRKVAGAAGPRGGETNTMRKNFALVMVALLSLTIALAAVSCGKKTRHMVQRRTEVVTVATLGDARVQRHAGADRGLIRPSLGVERTLRGKRRLGCARRGRERCAEGIASGFEDVPAVRLDA